MYPRRIGRLVGETERTLGDLKREHGVHLGSHLTEAHGELSEQSAVRNYVRDLVLGFNDGVVSVYAVTAGIAGAAFTPHQVLVAGAAAAVAGALSMGAGEYISTKSQAQFYDAERAREEEHLAKWPHLEKQELRESFEAKGFKPPLLDEVVDAIAADHGQFLDHMMREEFGVGRESARSPWRASGIVMLAFLAGAAFPLVPYGINVPWTALGMSSGLSFLGLFVAGVVRARASRLPQIRAGLEMVLIGAVAAAVTYGVGMLVGHFV